jgi:hypothetical protein
MGAALKSLLKPPKNAAGHWDDSPIERADPARSEEMPSKTLKVENTNDKSASKAERHEARLKRQAARAEKSGGDRPVRLCTLGTVEVKKEADGYHVAISSSGGRRAFRITPDEVGPLLKDLETAIHVIRGQQ